MNQQTENLISVKDLATFLNVTERTIYNMVEINKIPFYRIGATDAGDYRFDKQAVLDALIANKV